MRSCHWSTSTLRQRDMDFNVDVGYCATYVCSTSCAPDACAYAEVDEQGGDGPCSTLQQLRIPTALRCVISCRMTHSWCTVCETCETLWCCPAHQFAHRRHSSVGRHARGRACRGQLNGLGLALVDGIRHSGGLLKTWMLRGTVLEVLEEHNTSAATRLPCVRTRS